MATTTAHAHAHHDDTPQTTGGKYYVPHDSPWPIYGSATLFVLMIGVCGWLNEWYGPWLFLLGLAMLFGLFAGWFGTVIGENQKGMYDMQVDKSFRMGMMWFIFSEVMFFAAFFGALLYARQFSIPWLGGEGTNEEVLADRAFHFEFGVIPPQLRQDGLRLLFEVLTERGHLVDVFVLLLRAGGRLAVADHRR